MKPRFVNMVTYVWASDWDRSLKFYRDVLGCSVSFESDGWVELSLPGLSGATFALNRRDSEEPPPRNEFVTLNVDDLDGFLEHLEAHGVQIEGDVWEYPEEGLRLVKFRDPDGNLLAVAQVVR